MNRRKTKEKNILPKVPDELIIDIQLLKYLLVIFSRYPTVETRNFVSILFF